MYLHEVYLADNPIITATGQVQLMVNEHVFIGIGIRGMRLYKLNVHKLLIDDSKLKAAYLKMRIGDDVKMG